MKIGLCLAILLTSAAWADEAADRTAVERTISALNASQALPDVFSVDFPNAAELKRLREGAGSANLMSLPALGRAIPAGAGTLVVSPEPMGEAAWYPAPGASANLLVAPRLVTRFVTRSVVFVAPDTAVVVATYERQPVLFVVKKEDSDWRIASFRLIPEAQSTQPSN